MAKYTKSIICISEREDIKKVDFATKPGLMIITFNDGDTVTYEYKLRGKML